MSTKIYNAFRLECKDFSQFYQSMQELRPELKRIAGRIAVKEITRRAVAALDEFCLDSLIPDGNYSPFGFAYQEFVEEVRETVQKRERNPRSDLAFELSLFLYKDSYYVILFSEQDELINAFKAKIPCSEYDYYDGCDSQLQQMSEEEWYARRDNWKEILCNWKSPAMSGCSFTLTQPFGWLSDEERATVGQELPAYERRCRKAARMKLLTATMEPLSAEEAAEPDQSRSAIRRYLDAEHVVREGLEDGSLTGRLEELVADVQQLLPADPGPLLQIKFSELSTSLRLGKIKE